MKKLLLSVLSSSIPFLPALANDWPQWRGPNRDDVSTEKGLLKQWPQGGPPLAWKATSLGSGHGGVAVAAGKVFVTGDTDKDAVLFALSEAEGKLLWSGRISEHGGDPPGPRSTPTVDGERVYVLGQLGDLVCFETAAGKELWRKNLQTDFGGRCGGWKYSESPLVDGDKLICTPGSVKGSVIALSKRTGELLWQTKDLTDTAEYSSPILAQIGGVRQYIQFTGTSVVGIDPDAGKLFWRARRQGQVATIPTPVFYDDCVYVTSGYDVGCNLFRISTTTNGFKAEQVYASKVMTDQHGGVLRVGDYLYGHSDSKGWVCQEFKTGRLVWNNDSVGKGSLTCADGHLYLRSEAGKGQIALVEATPEGYHEKARFDQPERSKESSWAHPVVANGKLFIHDQSVLLCFEVKEK